MLRYIFIFLFLGAVFAHSRSGHFFGIKESNIMDGIRLETIMLNDSVRSRLVPIAIYSSKDLDSLQSNIPVIFFSHGYGQNYGDSYLTYSYLCEFLASKGYAVVSIQHEVKTDPKLPMQGNLQELRRPIWERGGENIDFVISELQQIRPAFNLDQFTLVGHSNGGDISALYAANNPSKVLSLITLDNLRCQLPKKKELSVLSLRAADTKADPGVLPDIADQRQFGMKLVYLTNTNHSDMNDKAKIEQREEIIHEIEYFLASSYN